MPEILIVDDQLFNIDAIKILLEHCRKGMINKFDKALLRMTVEEAPSIKVSQRPSTFGGEKVADVHRGGRGRVAG